MVGNKVALVNLLNKKVQCFEMEESLGVQYIQTYLKNKGISVDIYDMATHEFNVDYLVSKILNGDYQVVGISVFQTTYDIAKQVIESINVNTNIHIVIGGYFPSLAYKEILNDLKNKIDGILFGEGEEVFYQYVKLINNEESFYNLNSFMCFSGEKIIVNQKMELINDLDSIPIPEREEVEKRKLAKIYTSRGCYGRCSFCSIYCYFGHGKVRWRTRSIDNILKEIKYLVNTHGIKSLHFVDDNFMGPGKNGHVRAKEIAEAIIENNLQITYSVEFRVNDYQEETVLLLRKSGLRRVFFGIESGVQKELDLMNKLVTVQQNIDAIKGVSGIGIEPNIGFMMFTPYTTFEGLQENIRFLEELIQYNCLGNSMLMSKMIIQPGFAIKEKLEAEGRIQWNNNNYEYELIDDGTREFYMIANQYYNLDLFNLNSHLGELKDKLFIEDFYDCTKHEYVMVRNLERDVFKVELYFFYKLYDIVKSKVDYQSKIHSVCLQIEEKINVLTPKVSEVDSIINHKLNK